MKTKILSFLFASFCVISAQASLNIELTRGVSGAIPLAVVPFAGQVWGEDEVHNLAKVIQDDLRNSGRLQPMNVRLMQQQPHHSQDIDFSYWQNEQVDYVLVGSVEPVANNQLQVDFSLVNVFDSPKSTGEGVAAKVPDQKQIILHQVLSVKPEALRRTAHHISDLIYEKLTGERGVFSTKIAYIQVVRRPGQPTLHRLQVADADGYNPRMILESPLPLMSPAWSPDGRYLAYVSFEAKRARIYISDVRTGRRRLMTSFPGINGAPAWSPDGTKLAVVLSKDGNTGQPKLYTINIDGTGLKQLTHGHSIDTEPSWTADGSGLVFTSNRGGSPQIYLLTLKNGEVQRLTYDGDYNARASFSHNGRFLAMLHREDGKYNIAVMDMKSGELRLLTHSVANESPGFAPNGRLLVFASGDDNHSNLGIASIDGRVLLTLPASEGVIQAPAWSPYLLWS